MSQIVFVIIDMGSFMFQKYSQDNQRRIDVAIEAVQMLIQQKILYEKSTEIGIILTGIDDPQNDNIMYIQPPIKPSFQLIRCIQSLNSDEMNKEKEQSTIKGGNIMIGIDYAIYAIEKLKGKKQLKIYVITNGEGPCTYNSNQFTQLCDRIRIKDVKINIIGIDFNINDGDQIDIEKNLTEQQKKNKKFIDEFLRICGSNLARFYSSRQTMNIFAQLRTIAVSSRCKMRTDLEITHKLKIQVKLFTKTTEQKFPSLSKYSKVPQFDENEKSGKVQLEKIHFETDDASMEPINDELKIQGYYYGKQLVPVSKVLQEEMQLPTISCLKILAFCKSSDIPRQNFMSGVDVIIPLTDSKQDEIGFNALIQAMVDLNKVGIIRYVSRKNSQAKLATIYPHKTQTYCCFWLVTLPTIEDIRYFQFNSLKEPNENQLEAASDLIDAMDLIEEFDEIKPKNLFNPQLQYLSQILVHKAMKNESDQLPQINKNILDYLHPELIIQEKCDKEIQRFKEAFDLKENEAAEQKKKVFWRQLIQENSSDKQSSTVDQNEYYLSKKFENANKNEIIRQVGDIDPINDFETMIKESTEDLVEKAMTGLQNVIINLVEQSLNENFYDKAIQCLIVLRKGAITEDEPHLFNQFMHKIRELFRQKKQNKFWNLIQEQGISLILKTESKHSDVTIQESVQFLIDTQQKVMEIEEKIQPSDELFDDLD